MFCIENNFEKKKLPNNSKVSNFPKYEYAGPLYSTHILSAYTKSLSINGVITAGDAGSSKFLEEHTVLGFADFSSCLI